MQSEINDIRTACKVLEILNASEKGLSPIDIVDGLRCIRDNLDLIEAQQAVNGPDGLVNLPVMTLAAIARAAARERLSQGRAGLTVIEGGRHG